MKVKLIIISIILLLVMVFACGCIPFMEKIGLINPTNEEQLSPEKASSDGLVKVLIGFTKKPGPPEQALVRGVGGKIKYTYNIVDAIAASIPEKAIDALQKKPNVRYVEPDGQVFALQEILPWGVDRIDAEVVHASTGGNKGAGVRVAIIDTGIDYMHEDLIQNYKSGIDIGDVDEDPMDDSAIAGHGTHVAGIVAAEANGIGVIGVAPEAYLYAVKVFDSDGIAYDSDVIAGIEWCIVGPDDKPNTGDELGIQVINMSIGRSGSSESLEDACDVAYAAEVVLVAAAGNNGNPPGIGDNVIYPAAYESVIAVAATDQSDKRARWSSTGPAVELAAPGVSIPSTLPGNSYDAWSGTSMASPHVAGVAALVIASGISGAKQIRSCLTNRAENINLSDTQQGSGLVDAENAVLNTTNGDDLTPHDTGNISGTVTSADTGLPIEGGLVTANEHSTYTDADGMYTLADLPVGDYTVTASADGYENDSQEAVTVSADTTTFNVDFALNPLPANGTMYVESIVFSSKVAGPNKFLYTTVKVLDGSGDQLLGGVSVEMTLTRESGSTWYFDGDTKTDGTVKFTLAKAPIGHYTATVTKLILTDYTWDTNKGVTSASCELQDDG